MPYPVALRNFYRPCRGPRRQGQFYEILQKRTGKMRSRRPGLPPPPGGSSPGAAPTAARYFQSSAGWAPGARETRCRAGVGLPVRQRGVALCCQLRFAAGCPPPKTLSFYFILLFDFPDPGAASALRSQLRAAELHFPGSRRGRF